MPLGTEGKTAGTRSLLVDVVRGLAISLVALGHTDQGVEHRGWWGTSVVGSQIERFIYSFHMPAFFFVSGIFICQSVAKRGPRRFLDTKVSQMIYPWVLWGFLQYALDIPLQRFMSEPVYPWKVFLLKFAGGEVLWFLPTIFFAVAVGMLLRKVKMPVLLAGTVLVQLYLPQVPVNFVDRGLRHLPFLVAGMWLGRNYERLEKISVPFAAGLAVAVGVAMYLVTSGPLLSSKYTFVPLGLAGTLMLFLLARCVGRDGFARAMAWAGEASFGIYLMSAYAQGAGRELVRRGLHSTNPYLQLLLPTLLAIAVPAWIYQHRVRLRLGWLFLWPFGKSSQGA